MTAKDQRRQGSRQAGPDAAREPEDDSTPTDAEALAALRTLRAWLAGPPAPAVDPLILFEQLPGLYSGVSARMASEAASAGTLTAVRIGRKPAARRSDIETWLASRRVQPRARSRSPGPVDPAADYLALVEGGRR